MEIINIKETKSIPKNNYVYIGRGSKWGNPFIIGMNGNREEVIKKHMDWINGKIKLPFKKPPTLKEIIEELSGKVLGCFCKPLSCHGENYIKIIVRDKSIKKSNRK